MFYIAKRLQRIFSKVDSRLFSKSAPKKVFKTSQKLQRIFRECIQDDSSEKICTQEKFRTTSGKFSILWRQRKIENFIKNRYIQEILNQDLHDQENHKSFDIFHQWRYLPG